ncbi:hypothetical protein C2845_PM02G25230 [Panicum miliaceum]|uniref:Uncharacterized protein n=1 Tax=Panicum miliaceum TaxID=4540 RepID=A0A3L6S6R1_PANMI|nr:hypothetical protein C2845_PM02G25230 [Panicum miliaceum]
MTLLYSRKELKLIVPVVLLASLLLLLLQFQSASCSSSCCFDQRGGAAVGLLQGRRLFVGRGEAIAKGLMKPVVAKEAAGHALGEEDKREVITGPNPLHNRR